MPKTSTKITYTFNEILSLIKKDQQNENIKVSFIDIKESGDYDRGTYKREIKQITFSF
ncbi:hypothetical protein [Pedobacter cryophilus]|uniref:hypothetical protein n=1 Tax=Pedobacter cryophilus TaxID=2571271 RepID=UPI00145D2FBA|nr:hypothetical protein [Pedobacter cryophilus]